MNRTAISTPPPEPENTKTTILESTTNTKSTNTYGIKALETQSSTQSLKGILKVTNSKYCPTDSLVLNGRSDEKKQKSYRQEVEKKRRGKKIVKEMVLERKHPKAENTNTRNQPARNNGHGSIEGYQPFTNATNVLPRHGGIKQYPFVDGSTARNSSTQKGMGAVQTTSNRNRSRVKKKLDTIPTTHQTQNPMERKNTPTNTKTNIKIPKSKSKIRSISELICQQEQLSNELASLSIQPKEETNTSNEIEADVQFSYMSHQEYEELQKGGDGKDPLVCGDACSSDDMIPEEENDDASNDGNDEEQDTLPQEDEDKESSNDICDFFMADDEIPTPPSKPKPFIILWSVLSTWVTPQAVQLIQHWKTTTKEQEDSLPLLTQFNEYNLDDVSHSRYKGLLSLLELYLPPCWKEISPSFLHSRATVERRVMYLTQYFDYAQSMPSNMDSDLWKCLVLLLMHIVLVKRDGETNIMLVVPSFIRRIGLSEEEFFYLMDRSFVCFS